MHFVEINEKLILFPPQHLNVHTVNTIQYNRVWLPLGFQKCVPVEFARITIQKIVPVTVFPLLK